MGNARRPLDLNTAILGLLTVISANLLYLAGLSAILDPMTSMEPFYIHMARQSVAGILVENPAWGPLYALWLKPFCAVFGDPLAVYAANLYALSFCVSTLVYLHLLVLTRRPAVAAGVALFFLVSDLNVPLSSKVNGFALMVVLAGLTMAQLFAAGSRRTTIAAVAVLVASYVRPELYGAGLCLLATAVWLARAKNHGGVAWPLTGLAVTSIVAVWIGTPVFSPYHDNDRLFVAFREHFAWNWGKWHDGWQYYLSVWQREFDGAESILQAFFYNPGAVLHHLTDNLFGTVRYMVGPALRHYPFLAPANHPALVATETVLFAVATFGVLTAVVAQRSLRRRMLDEYGHILLPYAFIAAFCFASSILIFPRAHYLVLPATLLMLTAGLGITVLLPRAVGSLRMGILAALVTLAALPRPFILPTDYTPADAPFLARIALTRPVTDTVALIRSLNLPPPVHVLTLNDGVAEMLGDGFHEVKVWQRGTRTLQQYIQDEHVDVIVTLEPGHQSFLLDDPYWQVIQFTPEKTGFTAVPMPGSSPARVWVRKELAAKGPGSPNGSANE